MTGIARDGGIGAGKLTYEDLVALPEDGRRYEILDGDLVMTPTPPTRHQVVVANLATALYGYVKERGLGRVLLAPTDLILDEHSVVQPDILFIRAARRAIIKRHAVVGAPDLVVEVMSAATVERDRAAKPKLYARSGVEHYWIVDPDKNTLEAFLRDDGTYANAGKHAGDVVVRLAPFVGCALDLADVWD